MRITEILKQKGQGVSFEFFPPKTEKGKESLLRTINALSKFEPLYTSMTCGAGGVTHDKTQEAVAMLLQQKGLEVMPHVTCVAAAPDSIRSSLDRYKEQGIDNIMALRGDIPEDNCIFSKSFSYAKDLVSLIKNYNHFCIGAAVYPEGHIETSSLKEDLEYTKEKIDTGTDFAVTQMFFDNSYYYSLLERMNKANIKIPVLPGILPLTDISKVKQFVSICRTTIPKEVEDAMSRFISEPEEMQRVGIDFTIKQCRDLIDNGFRQIHFFTLNKPKIISEIVESIY